MIFLRLLWSVIFIGHRSYYHAPNVAAPPSARSQS